MQREEGAPKRFWARHKTQAVLRLLRGEDIDLVMVNGDVASSLTFRRDGWDARLESLTGAPLPWPDVLPGEPA